MNHLNRFFFIPVLLLVVLGHPQPSTVAQATPVIVLDGTFDSADWSIFRVKSVGGTSHAVQQATAGGNPDAFRSMTHTLPPVPPGVLAEIIVTHLYLGSSYDPGLQGAIDHINYGEDGKMLSLPWPDAAAISRLALVQDDRLFLSNDFLDFIGNTSWQSNALANLTVSDFAADGGSGDRPDFSASGNDIKFGYTRSNTRSAILPPVPPDQDLVLEHGIDNWTVTIFPEGAPPGPRADLEESILCLDCVGENYVKDNESDADYTATVSNLGPNTATGITMTIELDVNVRAEPPLIIITAASQGECQKVSDTFTECNLGTLASGENATIDFRGQGHYEFDSSNAAVWAVQDVIVRVSANEDDPVSGNNFDGFTVYFYDCREVDCILVSLFCSDNRAFAQQSLHQSSVAQRFLNLLRSGGQFFPDLITYYRLRDEVMTTPDGRHYVDLYYTHDPETRAILFADPALMAQGLDTLAMWEPNLQALVDGQGDTVAITAAQVQAIDNFLVNLYAAASPELKQIIDDERARLGEPEDYVGLTVKEAKSKAIGDPAVYLPLMISQ